MKKRCFRLFAGVLALAVMMTYTVIWNPSQAEIEESKNQGHYPPEGYIKG